MDRTLTTSRREHQTQIINFRVSASVEAQLASHQDAAGGINSPDKVARKILLEALAEREDRRRQADFDAAKLTSFEVFEGNAGRVLACLPARSCQICVTSPPYWRQRDYRHRDQLCRETDSRALRQPPR